MNLILVGLFQIWTKSDVVLDQDEKVQYSKYIIKMLLTFLEQINIEQEMERELEAKIQGKLYHSIFTFQTSRQIWKNTWNEFTIS